MDNKHIKEVMEALLKATENGEYFCSKIWFTKICQKIWECAQIV